MTRLDVARRMFRQRQDEQEQARSVHENYTRAAEEAAKLYDAAESARRLAWTEVVAALKAEDEPAI